jgi:uncharacterized coiled-coil DUF342 family protein
MSYANEIFRQINEINSVYKTALDQGDANGNSARALRRLIRRVEAFEREMTLSRSLPMHQIAELREAVAEARAALPNTGATR